MNEPHNIAEILITLGGLFLVGLLADLAGRHSPLPRVTLLLLAGFLVGPSVLDWLPEFTNTWFPVLTDIALSMIGFLLGQKLTGKNLRELGRVVVSVSIGEVLMTALLVFAGLALIGVPVEIAMLLAGIAPASDPVANVDIVREYQAKGRFTDTLLSVLIIDDAWGLLLFSILFAMAQAIGGIGDASDVLASGIRDIGAASLLGLVLGLPMAFLTGRVRPGEPSQAEALGLVLLCAGLAVWLDVPHILAAMVLGAIVSNFATHHDRPFHAIEGFEWPFMILFFLLAGAALQLDALATVGLFGAAYIGLRIAGLVIGAYAGAILSRAEPAIRHWVGWALLPQAGVAIGMALLASQRFPDFERTILPIALGSTVFFELVGPVIARRVLINVGDIRTD